MASLHTHVTKDIKSDGSCPRCAVVVARWRERQQEINAARDRAEMADSTTR